MGIREIESRLNEFEKTQEHIEEAMYYCPDKYINEELKEVLQEVENEIKELTEIVEDNAKYEIEQLNREYERSVL